MPDLSGLTVLITGAAGGIGEAMAKGFANAGANLALVDINDASELASRLGAHHQSFILDLEDPDAIKSAVAKIGESMGIDVLVNNAGLALGLEPAPESDISDWNTMVDTNIKGLMYCTRATMPGMVDRNQGHIVNIGSVAGDWPYPGGNVYGATKAFVKQFSRNLRADLFGTAIRVTNIEPGLAETEFSVVRFKGDEKKAAKVYDGTHPITPEDMAKMVHWVVSLPPHININRLEVMPVCQTWGPFAIHRDV